MSEFRHLSVPIALSPRAVFAFAGHPANLPRWAAGLAAGVRAENGRWIADSPMGAVEVRFVGDTAAGILDHEVMLPDGSVVLNQFRILADGAHSLAVFHLRRAEGVTDEAFEADAAAVQADLDTLKDVLEAGASEAGTAETGTSETGTSESETPEARTPEAGTA
ncbi:SRPBCC family protein [Sinomonas sp. ASV486]|uniref:SRPBCC family protein n=1 Tax=Sinomonas sp. ASV486 TaxID=3051170 RepID=UPI0027DD3F33|nr:SRPBCC family protein [Sinomonas sp. ASV486]MDQ4491196.1 SRPBCC family protein [Sinomonas sp. ASV486]MDQ4491856.1 SRPBCC family protein [Sinomonas sp. ASV486]MDQ4491976.1 SRPBCC family protein [Sinomonas sp. ASV486]